MKQKICVCRAIDSPGKPLCPSGVVVYQGKNVRHLMTSLFWFTFLCNWIQNFVFSQHIGICRYCLYSYRDCNCFCLQKNNYRFILSKSSCCIVIHVILISYMFFFLNDFYFIGILVLSLFFRQNPYLSFPCTMYFALNFHFSS